MLAVQLAMVSCCTFPAPTLTPLKAQSPGSRELLHRVIAHLLFCVPTNCSAQPPPSPLLLSVDSQVPRGYGATSVPAPQPWLLVILQ